MQAATFQRSSNVFTLYNAHIFSWMQHLLTFYVFLICHEIDRKQQAWNIAVQLRHWDVFTYVHIMYLEAMLLPYQDQISWLIHSYTKTRPCTQRPTALPSTREPTSHLPAHGDPRRFPLYLQRTATSSCISTWTCLSVKEEVIKIGQEPTNKQCAA